MFKGSVSFVAQIKDQRVTFSRLDFNLDKPGVDKVEIEGLDRHIHSTVHLATVESHEAGISLAKDVNTTALNRIAFSQNIAIENAHITGKKFSPLHPPPLPPQPPPGVHLAASIKGQSVARAAEVVIHIPADQLKIELEREKAPGEHNYGLFQSARQSMGPVEEFMHLYHILLMLYNDWQNEVDAFILSEDPSVPQTQQPPKPPRGQRRQAPGMETVYTRLRNEFAHKRANVDLEQTKAEMARRLGDLRMLTKRAIELHP